MLPPATYIDNSPALHALLERLQTQDRIACDTESNSLHAYRGKTCLIQISTASEDILIDPLAIDDIKALGAILANPAIEKVFHAAEYDLIRLKHDFDFDVCGVFDTMAAARVCGYQRIGLGNMLEDLLGIKHSKKHQRADWGRRPLPESYRQYAQMDTHYLLSLRDTLYAELRAAGRLDEAFEYFEDVTRFELKSEEFDPEGFWKLCQRPNSLKGRQLAVLRELYILRDELAKSHDHPSQRLISNKTLLQIVADMPRKLRELQNIRGLPKWLLRQSGDEILEAIKHGANSRLPNARPRRKPTPAPIVECYSALHNWRKQTALDRGVDSDVIISRNTLWDLARRKPATIDDLSGIPGLGPWRRQTYGAALLAIVNSNEN